MPKTVKTVDVTPIFNYDRHVEIVKRFIEQLTKHSQHIASPMPGEEDHELVAAMADYVALTIEDVRKAASEIITDNIETQIREKRFPLSGPHLYLHPFEPYKQGYTNLCVECDGSRTALAHVL